MDDSKVLGRKGGGQLTYFFNAHALERVNPLINFAFGNFSGFFFRFRKSWELLISDFIIGSMI